MCVCVESQCSYIKFLCVGVRKRRESYTKTIMFLLKQTHSRENFSIEMLKILQM